MRTLAVRERPRDLPRMEDQVFELVDLLDVVVLDGVSSRVVWRSSPRLEPDM